MTKIASWGPALTCSFTEMYIHVAILHGIQCLLKYLAIKIYIYQPSHNTISGQGWTDFINFGNLGSPTGHDRDLRSFRLTIHVDYL